MPNHLEEMDWFATALDLCYPYEIKSIETEQPEKEQDELEHAY